ncbi:MAG: hypothetical protein GF398_07445 [Chitinivibrionales bacterium]|nr:hypothetical protein [Chitinivibrionales bacterium]
MEPPRTQEQPSTIKLYKSISAESILDIEVTDKAELFSRLSKAAIPDASSQKQKRIVQAIQYREAEMSTYVGNGIAIPHAYVEDIEGLHFAMARNPNGFPYEIDTEEPIIIVILVIGGSAYRQQHLHILQAIAKFFTDTEKRDKVVQAKDALSTLRRLETRHRGKGKKLLPITGSLFKHAASIIRETDISAVIAVIHTINESKILDTFAKEARCIVATYTQAIADICRSTTKHVILLPSFHANQLPGSILRFCTFVAMTHGLLKKGDKVLFLSSHTHSHIDTLSVITIEQQLDPFVATEESTDAGLGQILERIITICSELGTQGREGKPIGTLFVLVNEQEDIEPFTQQMVINPFQGHDEKVRNILDPTLVETIKEFATIDGAFVVKKDGTVLSAGTFIKNSQSANLPGGLGSRHRVACGITISVNCFAIALSQSTGTVTAYRNGTEILSLPRGKQG